MRKKRKPPPGRTGRGHRTGCDQAKDHAPTNIDGREQSKDRQTSRVSFWPGREPFTVTGLQEILKENVLNDRTMPSTATLSTLAAELNDIHGAFLFRKTTASELRFKEVRAARVREAIQILTCFFDQRRQSWRGAPAEHVDREQRLYDLFINFAQAMMAHDFQMEMDNIPGALMPRLENWSQVADFVADAFSTAMLPQKFGRSNKGPVARFVAAVMPMITGESPAVTAVAQNLKRRTRKRGFQQGHH